MPTLKTKGVPGYSSGQGLKTAGKGREKAETSLYSKPEAV